MAVEDFNKTTNLILLEMVKNQNLCKLVYYDDVNPLSQSNIINTVNLIKKTEDNPMAHFFRQPKIPTVDDVGSFIVVSLDNFKMSRSNPLSQYYNLNFIILVHKDCWLIDGGERIFFIRNELDNSFDRKYLNGIGEVEFNVADRFSLGNGDFYGFRVQYTNYDFR